MSAIKSMQLTDLSGRTLAVTDKSVVRGATIIT
jgi:hypothetical protein